MDLRKSKESGGGFGPVSGEPRKGGRITCWGVVVPGETQLRVSTSDGNNKKGRNNNNNI